MYFFLVILLRLVNVFVGNDLYINSVNVMLIVKWEGIKEKLLLLM